MVRVRVIVFVNIRRRTEDMGDSHVREVR